MVADDADSANNPSTRLDLEVALVKAYLERCGYHQVISGGIGQDGDRSILDERRCRTRRINPRPGRGTGGQLGRGGENRKLLGLAEPAIAPSANLVRQNIL